VATCKSCDRKTAQLELEKEKVKATQRRFTKARPYILLVRVNIEAWTSVAKAFADFHS